MYDHVRCYFCLAWFATRTKFISVLGNESPKLHLSLFLEVVHQIMYKSCMSLPSGIHKPNSQSSRMIYMYLPCLFGKFHSKALPDLASWMGTSPPKCLDQVLPTLWTPTTDHTPGALTMLQPVHAKCNVSQWMDCRADAHLALRNFAITTSRSADGHT